MQGIFALFSVIEVDGTGEALVELTHSDACPLFFSTGEVNVCDDRALGKRIVSDEGYSARDYDSLECGAVTECLRFNRKYSVGNTDLRKRIAKRKCTVTDTYDSFGEIYFTQRRASQECKVSNFGDGFGNILTVL